MNLKRKIAAVLVLVLLVSLSGCGQKTEAPKETTKKATQQQTVNSAYKKTEAAMLKSLEPLPKASKAYKLAALEITLANPFWVTVKQGYEDAAKEYGVSIDVLSAPKKMK
jgi:ABC-type sugar transport system substrate-binding protein